MSEQERAALSKAIRDGIRRAQKELFERKAKLGELVAVAGPDGKPVLLPAEEMLKRLNSSHINNKL